MAAALVGVLVLARVFALAGRDLPLSWWLPSVLLWQDVAVGLVFWILERSLRPPSHTAPPSAVRVTLRRLMWAGYWAVVLWTAINVPVTRALSSPLTLPMLRATDGPLGDSIAHYATAANVVMIALVVAAGAVLPRVRLPCAAQRASAFALLAIAIPGPFMEGRVDTRGAQRNAVSALVQSALPRLSASGATTGADWRTSPFGASSGDDLHTLRGSAEGRNVLMIILESTAARYLQPYGARDDPMPTLTALGRNSIRFESAYAVYPESIKGLFAVLCSRHPAIDVDVETHASAPCTPLGSTLAQAGYQTAMFHSGRFAYLGMNALISHQGFETLEDAGAIGGQRESSFGVDEPSTVARVLSWIDGRDRSRPFFVAYLPVAGHHPYATAEPGPFSGEGDLIAYKNALHDGDASIARLLDGLRTRGLDRRTMVVVFGDHGEAFGQHDGNYGHTLFAFDENVRVPMLVSVPGATDGGLHSRRVASVVDVAPTILDLAGVRIPDGYEGTSLLTGDEQMSYFFTDYALGWAGVRDRCWKYLLEIEADRSQLFDVCADPDETIDRSREHPERVRAYRERTLDWLRANRGRYTD